MITDQFIHIHVPKTAGQMIRGLINEKKEHWKFYNESSHIDLKKSIEIFKSSGYTYKIPSFAFVRNPWEWYVSRFFFRQRLIEDKTEKQYIMIERTNNSIDGFREHMNLLKETLFSDKNHVITNEGGPVWGRTYMYLTLTNWHYSLLNSSVDHIGRLENFSNDLSDILSTVAPKVYSKEEIRQRTIRDKANESKHPFYKDCYTSNLIDFVYNIDEKYIKEFNYKY